MIDLNWKLDFTFNPSLSNTKRRDMTKGRSLLVGGQQTNQEAKKGSIAPCLPVLCSLASWWASDIKCTQSTLRHLLQHGRRAAPESTQETYKKMSGDTQHTMLSCASTSYLPHCFYFTSTSASFYAWTSGPEPFHLHDLTPAGVGEQTLI